MIVTALPIAADHPAYAGHFPGAPLLPGVVLLDATLDALEKAGKGPAAYWEVGSAKFQSAVRPGEALTLHHETLSNGSIRFAIRAADRAIANGTIIPSAAAPAVARGTQSGATGESHSSAAPAARESTHGEQG